MEPVDGNAIAGLLLEVFGVEMTTSMGVCGHCDAVGVIAEQAVYNRAPGTVVRCRSCSGVLMVLVDVRGTYSVDLEGFAAIERPAGSSGL